MNLAYGMFAFMEVVCYGGVLEFSYGCGLYGVPVTQLVFSRSFKRGAF